MLTTSIYRALSLVTLTALILIAQSCYEDNIACLDPDAANYDLTADDACPDDCCEYPSLTFEITKVWGDASFSADSVYTDAVGTRFRIQRLRFYLGDVMLRTGDSEFGMIENEQEIGSLVAGDTVFTDTNVDLALISATGATSITVGTFRNRNQPIFGLVATTGLSAEFDDVLPVTAPTGSPLAIQAGLLKFNNGLGYVSASLTYILEATNDTVRLDTYRDEPFQLDLPTAVLPARGSGATLLLRVDYQALFAGLDLLSDPAEFDVTVATALSLTGAR